MGSRDKNFYNDYAKRLGFETAAKQIQDLFLTGKRDEAAAAVPDELVDGMALVGSADRIRARVADWQAAAGKGHIHSILLSRPSTDAMKVVADAAGLT